jgi:hypothetical protein
LICEDEANRFPPMFQTIRIFGYYAESAPTKARGVKLGREPKLTPHQQREAIRRRDRGDETLAEIGRRYNVSGWTITRL